jgi:stage III sporulation protein SpoIIIAA
MSEPTETPEISIQERIEAARAEVRRAVVSDSVLLIHPFDMTFLLKNPTVGDAVLINMFERQFVVVDGSVYEQVSTVKNIHKLSEMMI